MAHVLVVDDEEGLRRSIALFLSHDGHAVVTASNMVEAESLFDAQSFDVIVTDIIMPGGNGIQLLSHVRERDSLVQVIMVTGEPTVETATEALRKGAFDYISKPFRKDAICKLVARAVEVKALREENDRLNGENLRHRDELERLVTERTTELRDSEERFRIAAGLASDLIYERDLETGVASFFGEIDARQGYGAGDFPRSLEGWRAHIHPDDLASILKQEEQCLRSGIPFAGSFRLRCKDGSFNHWLERWQVVGNGTQGGNQRIIGAATDITAVSRVTEERENALYRLRRVLESTIQAMALTVESRDPYTAGHQRSVASIAARIARQMKLAPDVVEAIDVAGGIHDLGKIAVPAEILSKPGILSSIERALVEQHPIVGHNILNPIDFPWPIASIVLQHHERMDGSGYPSGLQGDEILLEARVVAVADVIEAMASHRPYRAALGIAAGLAEVVQKSGIKYDPDVVAACLAIHEGPGFGLP